MKHPTTTSLKIDILLAGLVFLITLVLLMTSCKHDPLESVTPSTGNNGNNGSNGNYNPTPCDPDSVYFANTILPLITTNCAKSGCHDQLTHKKDLYLYSYSGIMSSGIVDAGRPWDSELMEVITTSDPDDLMPPPSSGSLTPQQIDLISDWISQGAPENSCTGNCDTSNVTFSGTILPLFQLKCNGCHNANTNAGNITLSSYAGAQVVALNGKLFGSVNHTTGYKFMPKGGAKLPQCEIDMIRIWVQAGAPNN